MALRDKGENKEKHRVAERQPVTFGDRSGCVQLLFAVKWFYWCTSDMVPLSQSVTTACCGSGRKRGSSGSLRGLRVDSSAGAHKDNVAHYFERPPWPRFGFSDTFAVITLLYFLNVPEFDVFFTVSALVYFWNCQKSATSRFWKMCLTSNAKKKSPDCTEFDCVVLKTVCKANEWLSLKELSSL